MDFSFLNKYSINDILLFIISILAVWIMLSFTALVVSFTRASACILPIFVILLCLIAGSIILIIAMLILYSS